MGNKSLFIECYTKEDMIKLTKMGFTYLPKVSSFSKHIFINDVALQANFSDKGIKVKFHNDVNI